MKREYLENGVKVFFGGLCIVLWQLVSEIRSDVKLLLKGDAEKTIEIQNLKIRLEKLENQQGGSPTRTSSVRWSTSALLPQEVSLKRKS